MNAERPYKQLVAIERSLSLERLSGYTRLARGDRQKAIDLYERNTAFSEALYTPLQGLEVAIRNACSIEMAALLGGNWYQNPARIFEHPATEMIDKAHRALVADGKTITPDHIIAELSFGFWVAILAPRYENRLWRPALRKAFRNRPKGVERKEIHKSLNALRRLRNRVAHHEPILQRDLVHDYRQIQRIIAWSCGHTAE